MNKRIFRSIFFVASMALLLFTAVVGWLMLEAAEK